MEGISLDLANPPFHSEFMKKEIYWDSMKIVAIIVFVLRVRLESVSNLQNGGLNLTSTII